MVKRNHNFAHLEEGYLFPEVARRARAFQNEKPLINLGIGDTSLPLPPVIVEALEKAARDSKGYGPEQGYPDLREKIAEVIYQGRVSPEAIFVSDGAKCDVGRLQVLFGSDIKIAVQDPAYPVYVDTSRALGQKPIAYLPCTPENAFFPETLPPVDLVYFCSPNNPTGTAATHAQLKKLVQWARATQTFILFDAAYAGFIQDPTLPRSIYEITGAEEVAIEVSSFSKLFGFTGVRLAWTVVPQTLTYENGMSVHRDWIRLVTTFFNGASCLSQAGGCAALSPEGQEEGRRLIGYYMENARLLRSALEGKGIPVYGGENAPYLWANFGKEKSSWEHFQKVLEETHLITTPGSGFGSCGEGFLRFSALGKRSEIEEAVERWQLYGSLLPT